MIKELFNKKQENAELGFGTKTYSDKVRVLNADGTVNVKRKGLRFFDTIDIYHRLITMPMIYFIGLVFISYIIINTFFAVMYYTIGVHNFGGITSTNHVNQFLELFFFSAQSLTTVGYGHIYPIHPIVSSLAAIEAMTGLLGFAIATGILYGRFSKPKATIMYSEHALLAPYKTITALMFRVANQKQNELIELEAQMIMAFNNPTTNKREFRQLTLERQRINFLALSWTIVHPIDDTSPLHQLTLDDLIKCDAEFLILIKSINDTYSQTVFSRRSYKADEIIDNAKFVPIPQQSTKTGQIIINLSDIHKFEPVNL